MFKSLTLKKAQEMIAKREISPEELTRDFLKRVYEKNNELNVFLDIFENAPAGLPCAIKDNIMIEGHKCTAGSKILENYIASYDATVIKKIRDFGASILGKANLDEFAMGATGEYSAFGPTKNPLDPTRVPGGSSSGSVAAVAADMALFGLGSETGGSVRIPAAWCGVVGLKPSYGRVSRHGLIALASSFDQVAPVAKTVEDVAIVLGAIAGHDPMDSTSADIPVPDYTANLNKPIKGMKIAVVKEFFGDGLDSQVATAVKKAISKLEELGAKVEEVSLPMSDYALATYYLIVPSEASSNLARYDGIRYGYQNQKSSATADKNQTLLDSYLNARTDGFGPEPRRRIMIGTYALSAGYYDAYYKKAQQVRTLIKQDFDRIFVDFDAIVGPTSATLAPKIGELDNPLAVYLIDMYMVQANLAGLCAISVPCGFGIIDGVSLPVGLQIIGNRFEEEKILNIAHIYECNH